MPSKNDLTGKTFNYLTVLQEEDDRHQGAVMWRCKCRCGKIKKVKSYNLTSGAVKSCGCLRKEKITKHGLRHTKEYKVLVGVKYRCNCTSCPEYKNYGGRGIRVCDRWMDEEKGFVNFLEDMGERPEGNYTIERLDVNGDYEKDNCCWIEQKYQLRNQRKRVKNTSGVTGVSLSNGKWTASWKDLRGIRKAKSFSINKYGDELAFFAACECREQMIALLNKQGAGYTERHGE